MIIYKKPNELMKEVLLQEFSNNQYFNFSEFQHKVKTVAPKSKIEYETVKDFIFQMLDEKVLKQEFIEDNESPFVPNTNSTGATKSIYYKLVIPIG
jgi:hypothetical protein